MQWIGVRQYVEIQELRCRPMQFHHACCTFMLVKVILCEVLPDIQEPLSRCDTVAPKCHNKEKWAHEVLSVSRYCLYVKANKRFMPPPELHTTSEINGQCTLSMHHTTAMCHSLESVCMAQHLILTLILILNLSRNSSYTV